MSLKNMAIWYVYELVDPVSQKVFYVGKGKGKRIDDHEREALRGVCSKKCNKIKSIINSGKQIIKHKVAMFWCEQSAYDHETDLIMRYGLENLTNILPGGQKAFERRVRDRKTRVVQRPLDPIELLQKSPHIIKHWSELTENGKYKVEPIITGNKWQDGISKIAANVYNNCIEKVIIEALNKSGGRLEIGSA